MSRKLETRLNYWIPHILRVSSEYDALDTLGLMKATGGILRVLGTPEEQLVELQSVLDWLKESKYLISRNSKPAYYYGINFTSTTYDKTNKFKALLTSALQRTQSKLLPNSRDIYIINNVQDNRKTFTVSLSLAVQLIVEKLLEFKAALINN